MFETNSQGNINQVHESERKLRFKKDKEQDGVRTWTLDFKKRIERHCLCLLIFWYAGV